VVELLSGHYQVTGVDVDPVAKPQAKVDVLHICFPFGIRDFVGESARYIELFRPALTIINSTVAIGTTRQIAQRTGTRVVHSPVRGKHARMLEELRAYTKFVGALESSSGQAAAEHFEKAGLNTKILSSPEASELAKLTETTYFGLLIAWAQEVERYCDRAGQSFEEVISFYEEIAYLPRTKFFPGIIGGHCVMPNIEILSKFDDSMLLKMIRESNRAKVERESRKPLRGEVSEAIGSKG
jgi:UDP-N-acetyl-D-mannosaminuronate dehydrogenase